MIYQYVCKFYLNASHFIYIDGKKGEPHSHCFEFVLDVATKEKESFVSFTEIEKSVENLLAPYQEKLLNDVKPFDEINPTLENIANYFKELFVKEIALKKWVLVTIELSETPTRSYLINTAEELKQNVLGNQKDKVFEELQNIVDTIHNDKTLENIIKNPVEFKNEESNTKNIIIKKDNLDENDYDYIIPEELMHYDT